MTTATSQKLADALRDAGFRALADRAEKDEFHLVLSKHDFPDITLDRELAAIIRDPSRTRLEHYEAYNIRELVLDGEFDASPEEIETWALSDEGQDAMRRLETSPVD